VADVQGVLKEEGFYKGEVDGLLGPMTREAVTAYLVPKIGGSRK
jgi:peptidoglycan hydrolase-like protein with peptidoglycan-binding domain